MMTPSRTTCCVGAPGVTSPDETLENVPVHVDSQEPNYLENPVRNMRMILSRKGLLQRKGAAGLISKITGGRLTDSVHVPMDSTDRVFWQEVMRQNTVIPPLRRLSLEQYIRVLMYGEAVQMGAAIGAIGRPYVEYFSDPFIIGLEDENANLLYHVLQQLAWGGMPQEYYAFNTGGVGADSNEEASGSRYRKIPRELTMMLQEALLRNAVKFEYDGMLRSEVAVAILDGEGNEVVDLRQDWLPVNIYGEEDYSQRVVELMRRRYYGRDQQDKAGILRYTKVVNTILDITDAPAPANERELSWLLSFYWSLDQAYETLAETAAHRSEGMRPVAYQLRELQRKFDAGSATGLSLGDSLPWGACASWGCRPVRTKFLRKCQAMSAEGGRATSEFSESVAGHGISPPRRRAVTRCQRPLTLPTLSILRPLRFMETASSRTNKFKRGK